MQSILVSLYFYNVFSDIEIYFLILLNCTDYFIKYLLNQSHMFVNSFALKVVVLIILVPLLRI